MHLNLIRIFTVVGLVGMMTIARATLRTWLNPVSALGGAFAAALIYQQMAIPHVTFAARASVLILAGTGAMFLGTSVTSHLARGPAQDLSLEVNPRRAWLLTLVLWVINVIALVYLAEVVKLVLIEHTDYVRGVFYREQFNATVGNGASFRLGLLVMYIGAVLFALDAVARGFRRLLPVVFVAATVAQSVVLSAKSSTLIILTIFGITLLLAKGRSVGLFSLRAVLGVLIVVGLGFYTFAAVTHRRAGGQARLATTFAYSYAGAPSGLSEVVDNGFDPNAKGFLTGGGLLDLVGRQSRGVGLSLNSVTLTPGEHESAINVYTWYLPLVHDFTTPGALVVIFGLGLVMGPMTARARAGRLQPAGLVVLVMLTTLLAWAPIVLLTYYNFWLLAVLSAPLTNLFFSQSPAAARSDALAPPALSLAQ